MKELGEAIRTFASKREVEKNSQENLENQVVELTEKLGEANRALYEKDKMLQQTSRHLNQILHHMTQALLFIQLDGKVTTCNRAAEKFFHLSSSSVLFHSFWDHFSDTSFGFSMREALQEREIPPLSYIDAKNPPHPPKTLEVSGKFLLHGKGREERGLILVIRDISEVRRWQILANRNERLKALGEMAAALAHEIRNPLGGIQGFSSLLYRDLEGQREKREMVGHILRGVQLLEHLVQQVLDYTRPLVLKRESCSILSILKEAISVIQARRDFPSEISIICQEESLSGVDLSLDRMLFYSVCLNLLTNAIQSFSSQKGQILISAQQEGSQMILHFSDNGQGIEECHLEKIFSPFFTTKHEGNGLGLAEVHKIVKAHGGEIDLVSEVGMGTKFSLKLPYQSTNSLSSP